jgi:exonuclease I
LYNGFIGNADRRLLNELRALPAEQLAKHRPIFRMHD